MRRGFDEPNHQLTEPTATLHTTAMGWNSQTLNATTINHTDASNYSKNREPRKHPIYRLQTQADTAKTKSHEINQDKNRATREKYRPKSLRELRNRSPATITKELS